MFKFAVSLFLIITFSLFQTLDLSMAGAKINPILPIIFILSIIVRDWFERIIMVLTAALIIKFYPGFELQNVIFIAIGVLGMAIMDLLPSRPLINILITTSVATVLINLNNFIPRIVLAELIYSAIFSIVIFLIIEKLFYDLEKKKIY